MNGQKFITSWSGGKDSCYAMILACNTGAEPVGLLSMMEENDDYSRSHRLSSSLLSAQAERLNLPLFFGHAAWKGYEEEYIKQLIKARNQTGANAVVFGDIDLQGHRDWAERICSLPEVTMQPLFPLWESERRIIVERMIKAGQKAMIVSCNSGLGKSFLGRTLDKQTLTDIENAGADVCGEHGEYHTFVFDCERFSSPVAIHLGECHKVLLETPSSTSDHYWYIDVAPTA